MRELLRESSRSYKSDIHFEQLLRGPYVLLGEKQKRRVDEVKPLAMSILAARELAPVATRDTIPQNIEKAWLVMALADAEMHKKSKDKYVQNLRQRIYTAEESNQAARETPNTYNALGPQFIFLHELFIRADLITEQAMKQKGTGSPETSWEPSYNAVCDVLRRVYHSSKYRDDQNRLVVTLPFYRNEAEGLIASYAKGPEFRNQGLGFAGICVPFVFRNKKERAIVFFQDSPPITKQHEYSHVDYPGLYVENFFASLDEGMTELRAYEQTPVKDRPRISNWISYPIERHLVKVLKENGLERILLGHYEKHTPATTDLFIAGVINRYGLSGYLSLARAYPRFPTNMPKELAYLGFLPTYTVARQLG